MRSSFQAGLIAISIALCVNADQSPPSCAKPYDKMTACNLICNMIYDSDANSAMKMLQTKMENLSSMIKEPSSRPGEKPNFTRLCFQLDLGFYDNCRNSRALIG